MLGNANAQVTQISGGRAKRLQQHTAQKHQQQQQQGEKERK